MLIIYPLLLRISKRTRLIIYGSIVLIAMFQAFFISDTHINSKMYVFSDSREGRFEPGIIGRDQYGYAPEGYAPDDFPIEYYSPKAVISEYDHEGIYTSFSYKSDTDTYIDIPLLFYKGYTARIKGSGQDLKISKGNRCSLRVTLPEQNNLQTVELIFTGCEYSDIVSIISLATAIILCVCVSLRYFRCALRSS